MSSGVVEGMRTTMKVVIIAVVLVLVGIGYTMKAYKMPSSSMLPNMKVGDCFLVNKLIYGVKVPFTGKVIIPVSDPKVNDVIVFKYPPNPSIDFIKRIVGTPGDKIKMVDKVFYRNGEKVSESFVQHMDPYVSHFPGNFPVRLKPDQFAKYFAGSDHMAKRDNFPEFTVPEGKYFCMGDNRDGSHDSRFWGFVDRKAIRGKAFIIYWSWESLTDIRWGRIGDIVR